MLHNKKSNVTNYNRIYAVLLVAINLFFLFITLNFLLPVANFISLFFLSMAVFNLILYLFSKKLLHLLIAISCCSFSILLSLLFTYIN